MGASRFTDFIMAAQVKSSMTSSFRDCQKQRFARSTSESSLVEAKQRDRFICHRLTMKIRAGGGGPTSQRMSIIHHDYRAFFNETDS